jgi:hypothetical protein
MKRWTWKLVSSCMVFFVLWKAFFALAQGPVRIEAVMANIAKTHNANPKLDQMTLSSVATASGRKVIFHNVMRIKKGLTPSEMADFQAEIREELLPQACAVNHEVFSWKKGISYVYVYDNAYGERIGELVIDERACGVK